MWMYKDQTHRRSFLAYASGNKQVQSRSDQESESRNNGVRKNGRRMNISISSSATLNHGYNQDGLQGSSNVIDQETFTRVYCRAALNSVCTLLLVWSVERCWHWSVCCSGFLEAKIHSGQVGVILGLRWSTAGCELFHWASSVPWRGKGTDKSIAFSDQWTTGPPHNALFFQMRILSGGNGISETGSSLKSYQSLLDDCSGAPGYASLSPHIDDRGIPLRMHLSKSLQPVSRLR